MNDKSELLKSLKIQDDLRDNQASGGAVRWILLVAIIGIVAAAGWHFAGERDTTIEIKLAKARLEGGSEAQNLGRTVLEASGYVVARRRATVSSKITGKVTELLIEEGSRVNQGDVLARIDDSNLRAQHALASAQLDAARAQLREVQVQLADARKTLKRTRELAGKKLLSESAQDSAQAAVDSLQARLGSTQKNVLVAERALSVQTQQLDDTIVRAPFDGVITVKNAQPGEMVSPLSAGGEGTRTGIGTLVDMSSLEVEVDVNENFINRVTQDQETETSLNAYPDWKIPSSVIAVIPTADRSKATVKVRIRLDQIDERILPDMGARVSFLAPEPDEPRTDGTEDEPALLVPSEAVLQSEDKHYVFVVDDGTVEKRAVRIGKKRKNFLVVEAGLTGGESLAASALDQLQDGSRVRRETK